MENKGDSSIPKAPSAKTPPVQELGSKAKNGGPERLQKQVRVLHVEDDPMIARMIKRHSRKSVEPENFIQANSAEDALAVLENDSNFDLILLDLRMPGMGGVKMIEHLLDRGRIDILGKIVALSGTAFDLIENERAFAAIGSRFLEKSGKPEDLSALLQWVKNEKEIKNWISPDERKKHMKVLIVDDEELTGRATARIFLKSGVGRTNVHYASSAEEARDIIEMQDFDIIVSDVKMPGIGGCGLVALLESDGRKDVLDRMILNTGTVDQVSTAAFEALGGRVIEKPVDPRIFESVIRFMGNGEAVKDWVLPMKIAERE
ncbi:MAG: response regulator [bacterium]|nr:response regulator [bacterium]